MDETAHANVSKNTEPTSDTHPSSTIEHAPQGTVGAVPSHIAGIGAGVQGSLLELTSPTFVETINAQAITTLHNPFTAWIILCLSLILTVVAWWVSNNIAKQRTRDRFDFRVEEITHAIRDRMNVYEQVLWGGVGLFNASGWVSRQEWEAYVETLDINVHWPGIQGIGFSIPVTKEDKENTDH